MAEPLNSTSNTNNPPSSDLFGLGDPFSSFGTPISFRPGIWPKQAIATPLKGVSLEVSSYPPSVTVMFDVLTLLQGGGSTAKAGKAAASARGLAAPAARAASKAVSKAAAGALKPGQDISLLESLKTFLAVNPGLSFFAPMVDFAILIDKFSPLQ